MKKIVVTGAAGFIGANIVETLGGEGYDIVAVDFKDQKTGYLEQIPHVEFIDTDDFRAKVKEDSLDGIEAIVHFGGCSSTVEHNTEYLMDINTQYTKDLYEHCLRNNVRLICASSAATYGDGSKGYNDDERDLHPLNDYGRSKHEFDEWFRDQEHVPPQCVSLKPFNVYGKYEDHKERMASMVYHGFHQIMKDGKVKLFKSHKDGFEDGGQMRDFVFVDDVCDVILHFLDNKDVSGIFNVGTGKARSFVDLEKVVFAALGKEANIEFIDMPEDLQGKYQYFTEADTTRLREVGGYKKPFTELEEGVRKYVVEYLLPNYEG